MNLIESDWIWLNSIKLNRMEWNQIESNPVKLNQIKLNWMKSSQIKSIQMDLNLIELKEIEWNELSWVELSWVDEGLKTRWAVKRQWTHPHGWINQIQWNPIKSNEIQWNPMNCNELQWNPMKCNEWPNVSTRNGPAGHVTRSFLFSNHQISINSTHLHNSVQPLTWHCFHSLIYYRLFPLNYNQSLA